MNSKHTSKTDLQIGREYPGEGEEKIITSMVKVLEAQLLRMYSGKKMLRQIHPKMTACVKAEFIIEPNLADDLKVGVFKDAKSFPTWIRFSNGSTVMKADKEKDIRGIAIKLMNVPGEKLLERERNEQTQDFILLSSHNFLAKNIKEFAPVLTIATAPGILVKLLYFFRFFRFSTFAVLSKALKANIVCKHPFEIPYWSTIPFRFGDENRAVKYFIEPTKTANNEFVYTNETDYNFLQANAAATLIKNEIQLDFCIQFQTDAVTMPIEDPTVPWTSPYIKLATIRIPKQICDTPERKEFGENLTFNSWHCLEEHRPLGSFNRARKRIYEEMYNFRLKQNNIKKYEPIPTPDFFTSDKI